MRVHAHYCSVFMHSPFHQKFCFSPTLGQPSGHFVYEQSPALRGLPGNGEKNDGEVKQSSEKEYQQEYGKFLLELKALSEKNPILTDEITRNMNENLGMEQKKMLLDKLWMYIDFSRYQTAMHEAKMSIESQRTSIVLDSMKGLKTYTDNLLKKNNIEMLPPDVESAIKTITGEAHNTIQQKVKVEADRASSINLDLHEYLTGGENRDIVAKNRLAQVRSIESSMKNIDNNEEAQKAVKKIEEQMNALVVLLSQSTDVGKAEKYIEEEADRAKAQVNKGEIPEDKEPKPAGDQQHPDDEAGSVDPDELKARKMRALEQLKIGALESVQDPKAQRFSILIRFQNQLKLMKTAQSLPALQLIVGKNDQEDFTPQEIGQVSRTNMKAQKDVNIRI